jgi:predicted site-specific integrase-resolvase
VRGVKNAPHQDLPTAAVAKALGVGTSTVHRLVESGELRPTVRFPGLRGAMLFRPSDVAKLARARAKATKAKAS